MRTVGNIKVRFYPFLYLLWFFVIMYSVEDMATSTNAYQQQGNRTIVYVYLISILAVLGLYYLFNFKIYTFAPLPSLLAMSIWILADNILLGAFFGVHLWSALTQFGLVFWWYLSVIFGYNYVAKNRYKEKQVVFLIIVMFIYYCYKFVEVAIVSNETHDVTTVLNLIYRIVVFVPIFSIMQNKHIKNIVYAVVFIFAVVSMKRGALIVFPAMLLVGSCLDRNKRKNLGKNIVTFIMIAIFAVVVIAIANHITDGFLAMRFSWEELLDGSNRNEKYTAAINEISRRGLFQTIFGVGAGDRPGIHNEMLDFLYGYGVVGLGIYLSILITMFRRLKNLYAEHSQYVSVYGMIFTFIFVVGLYSGISFIHSTFYIMLTLGIVERRISEERRVYV